MSYAEFLERLRQTPREWRLDKYGQLRQGSMCPLTALCEPPAGCGLCLSAVVELGLDKHLGRQIINAADYALTGDTGIRRDLLDACGLTHEPSATTGEPS